LRFMRNDWTAGCEAPHATRGIPLLHTFPGTASSPIVAASFYRVAGKPFESDDEPAHPD
jgi:hypothetical protein